MARMDKATQKRLGLNDAEADFDEFLQMDEGPESEAYAKAHGYQRGKPSPALQGLVAAASKK